MTERVVVIGGGLAGLFTASELMLAGVDDLLVIDASASPGGVTRTIRRDGYSLESAAGTLLLPHSHLSALLERIGADVVPVEPSATMRYVYTRGRLVAVPTSPKALLAPLVPLTAKLRAAAEPFVRRKAESEDESLDAFLRRRLGDGLGGMLAWLGASGVFAGDPARLSARSTFPAIAALGEGGGSIVRGGLRRRLGRRTGATRPTSHIPVEGMTGLVETLAGVLGERFRGGFAADSVRRDGSGWVIEGPQTIRCDHVVVATAPAAAAELLGGDLGVILGKAQTAPTVVVGLGGPSHQVPLPQGFGVLTGPDAGLASLGVLFVSSYAPGRAPPGHALAKVIAGGARFPELVDWDDARIVERVGGEVARILGTDIDPSFVEIIRHRAGIPQYEIGHSAWLEEIDHLLGDRPGLHLTGWGYRGVGVAHLASDAAATASRIVERTA
ncbi:MAG: protoporphyrinogen oxidase [Acidobacteria bacterium]|nr:protoporphyrinogen oxidase [Acidobacteriota bacterium]